MKKKLLILSIFALSLNSFSSIKLSSDEYLNGLFTSNAIKSIMQDSYDYEKDLAVASDRLKIEEDARNDALNGLKHSIANHCEKTLLKLFKNVKLSGQSFDESTMKTMSKELAEKIILDNQYTLAKIVKTQKNEYIVLVKISKNFIEAESKKIFKNRLKNVILRLNDLYNEIGE